MNTVARDVPQVLQRCIVLHEQERLPLQEAARQTQEEYNRYHQYQLRCVVRAMPTMSFLAWLLVEATYREMRNMEGTLDIVTLAELERQLALDVPV